MKLKVTLPELEEIVAEYVDADKISSTTANVTKDNIVGLVDKIGKQFTLDGGFYDKLTELDGDELAFGKTVEEWFQDLIPPSDFTGDEDGSEALKFYSPSYRPVTWSYTLGRKKFPLSIPYGNFERACLGSNEATNLSSMIVKRLNDSIDMFKYNAKRQLIGNVCNKIESNISGATAWTSSTNCVEGSYYKSGNTVYVCVKAGKGSTIDAMVSGGYLVPYLQKVVIAKPSDTTTGENFIIATKKIVEKAQDVSEGYSFNGNTIGAEVGLSMYVKQGLIPNLEVQTIAGAFHEEKLAVGVDMKVIKDFGDTTSKAYAILCDNRALRLFPGYVATRQQEIATGDFVTLVAHREFTAHASRNAFIVIFCEE